MTSIMIMIHSYVVSGSLSSPTLTSFASNSLTFWLCFSSATLLIYKTQGLCMIPLNDYGLSLSRARVRSFLSSINITLPVLPTFWPSDYLSDHPHLSFRHFRSSASLLVSSGRILTLLRMMFLLQHGLRSACFGLKFTLYDVRGWLFVYTSVLAIWLHLQPSRSWLMAVHSGCWQQESLDE